MADPDPRKIIFSSRYRYYRDYGGPQTGSVSIPATSYGAGVAKSYSLTVDLDRNDDLTHVKLNFSYDPSRWFGFPPVDLILDSFFTISTVGAYSGNQLTITFYVVNQSGLTKTNTATDVTAEVRRFIAP